MTLQAKLDAVAGARSNVKALMQGSSLFLQNDKWHTQITLPILSVQKEMSVLKEQFSAYKNIASGAARESAAIQLLQASGLYENIKGVQFGLISAPIDATLSLVVRLKKIREAVRSLYEAYPSIAPTTEQERMVENFKAEIESRLYKAENSINGIVADMRRISSMPDIYLVPSNGNADPKIVQVYGYRYVVAPANTSLDILAAQYCGSPDDGILIALANGISNGFDIELGKQLRIPLYAKNTIGGNMVYSRSDNYGTDIKLSDSGEIVVNAAGELATLSGEKNIAQAIRSRLAESIGNRIRLTVYGIKSALGHPLSAASAYVATSIKDTIIHDPRIAQVENFVFRGSGDQIYVQFDYTLIDGMLGSYRGTI